ncbi:hypothetical protein BGZ54_001097 [Gamsiella multidivaricata]|nr:hypothetical protein BGZ54_001097 [Gamsiella multidivaricata]
MPRERLIARQRLIRIYEDGYVEASVTYLESLEQEWVTYPFVLELYFNMLVQLYQTRYLKPRTQIPFLTGLRDRVLMSYDPNYFKDIVRLTPDQFNRILGMIRNNQRFRSADRQLPEEKSITYLKVELFRPGTRGLPIEKVAWIFGVNRGAVQEDTWRFIKALNGFMPQFVV